TPATTLGTTIASSIGWTVSGSSTIKLSALGTGQPQFLIIGPDKNGNFSDGIGNAGYTGSNSSIDGNGPHNPFILGNETFNFTQIEEFIFTSAPPASWPPRPKSWSTRCSEPARRSAVPSNRKRGPLTANGSPSRSRTFPPAAPAR